MSNARKLGNMTTHGLDGDFNVDPTDNTLVVDSTNNRVGIGSATPTTTLDITGTATATAFSGPLTGNVTGTTSSISNHDTDALSEGSTNLYYTNARADARAQLKIDALVDSAPGTLDTLNELAAALGDDANFSTTITNSIATKLPLAGGTLTGALDVQSTVTADGLTVDGTAVEVVSINSTQNGAQINFDSASTTNDWSIGISNSADGDFLIYQNSAAGAGDLRLYTNGQERLTILSGGNVGIGTTSPNDKLHIQHSDTGTYSASSLATGMQVSRKNSSNTTNQAVTISLVATGWEGITTGLAGISAVQPSNTSSADLVFQNRSGGGYQENMRIKYDGKVGIGTAGPDRALHIEGSDFASSTIRLKRTSGGANNDAGLQFQSAAGANADTGLGGIWFQNSLDGNTYALIRARTDDSTGTSGRLDFMTSTSIVNNTSTPSLTIKSSGNVGIGTTGPGYKLDVFNNTTDTGSQLRVKNAHTAVGADAVVNIDGYGASTLKLWRNGIEEWKLERITNSDNLGLYAYGGAVSGGAGTGLIQFWDYDTGGIGFGTDSPGARLEIYDSHGGNTGHSSYGHPSSGGSNGALYINKANSRIDWQQGLVFCGEGTTWSARFTGRDGLNTNSDTDGEILGVHPVEGSATAAWSDTAGANGVTSAFFRVMGNGKTFVKKLNSDAFRAPSHATDAAANSAGGNVAGSIYYNTASNVHRSYNGTQWTSVGSAPITESVFDAFRDGSALCLLKGNNNAGDTGGNHTGSLQGGATYTTTTKFGSHAFDLVGDGVYLDIPTLPMIETVSFWYYCVGGTPGYLVDFRHDNPNNGRSYLYTHAGASGGTGQHVDMGDDTTTTNRTGVIYINGAQYTSGQYNFLAGNWYHIVLVRNSTDTHRTWDQGIRFGNRSDGTTHGSAGHFDQIRVFNSRISASQAFDLYNETG